METMNAYESAEDHNIFSISEDHNDEKELIRESMDCWFPDSSF